MFRYIRIFFYFILISLPLTAQEDVFLPVPLYVDGEYTGEISLRINGKVLIQPMLLLERLSPMLNEEKLNHIQNRWSREEWAPVDALGQDVILAEFDDAALIFLVEIPAESRKPETFSLTRENIPPPDHLVLPARLSGVLNMEGWSRIIYEPSTVDFEFGPEAGVNYAGYLLEAKGGVQSGEDPFFGDYLRLVKDFVPLSLRAEAGTLTYDADGLSQGSMVGLSLFRKSSLDKNYQNVPELGQTIFFPEPVEVKVVINGKTVRRRSLPAGIWTFKNFPLNQGPNDVEILWTDSRGEHRESFFQIYDMALLKRGENDWGFSLGTDSWMTFNPAFLGHISRGLSHTFTAGAGAYYDYNNSIYAVEVPLGVATTWGIFQIVPSGKIAMEEGYGSGIVLNHTFAEKRAGRYRQSFGSSWGYHLETYPYESELYSSRAYYSYSPIKDLAFTPSVNWYYESVQQAHTVDFSVRIRKSGSDGGALSAQIGLVYDDDQWAPKAILTYSISFPGVQQNFYARGDISGEKMTVSWNRYSATDKDQDYTLAASAVIPSNREDRLTMSMSGGYIHPVFTAGLIQGFNAYMADEEFDNMTTFSAGTALVYADGVLGMSRPIRSEFVIIESQIGPISVNPTSRGSLLEVDGQTPGILSSLSPYRYTALKLMPEELPIGADINDYTLSVFPTYRSGTLIQVKEKIRIYAGGVLADHEGNPQSLVLGRISPYENTDAADEEWPRDFFTDEKGYFECYGLSPGKYLLTHQNRELTYIIDIAGDESGFFDLGEVKPED